MRILFDAYWWDSGPPSGRNIVRSLIFQWAAEFPGDEVVLLVRRRDRDSVAAQVPAGTMLVDSPRWAVVHALAALSAGMRGGPFDAVICQNFSSLASRGRRGVLVHDVMYLRQPRWFQRRERAYLAGIRPSLVRADVVFTTSASETGHVRAAWPALAHKTLAVGLAVPKGLAEVESEAVPDLPAPFILAVGRLNVRKNLRRLIEAFGASNELAKHALVIVGESDGVIEQLPEGIDFHRLLFLGGVSDAQLRWLYENAALFAFPSLDEGFGLPLLEARCFGAPIAASNIPVFCELGLADVSFDPSSRGEMMKALEVGVTKQRRQSHCRADWAEVVVKMRSALQDEESRR